MYELMPFGSYVYNYKCKQNAIYKFNYYVFIIAISWKLYKRP